MAGARRRVRLARAGLVPVGEQGAREESTRVINTPPSSEPPQPNHYDRLLKWLLTRARDVFLALIAPGYTWRAERSPELPSTLRQTDLVWEVEGADGRRRLLHIELQTAVDPDIGERLAEYMSRLWRRDHLPIRSVVVYLRPAERIPAAPFVIPWEENDDSQISRYGVVRLWEVPAERVLNSPSYALWPLAPLLAGATDETTVVVAERLAALDAPRQERGDLIGLLVGLAGLRRAGAAYETLVTLMRRHAMLDDLLRESSMAEMFIKEGREEGGREMAQVALEGRYGSLPADLLAALGKSDEGTLREIVAHIATDTLEQVRTRLGLGPQATPE